MTTDKLICAVESGKYEGATFVVGRGVDPGGGGGGGGKHIVLPPPPNNFDNLKNS